MGVAAAEISWMQSPQFPIRGAADTIYALASGAGVSAVAVVRLSGPASRTVLERLCGRCPPPRRATLATLRDSDTGEALDRGLALWFPAPASFTGEDGAELQVHGSRAVVAALLQALGRVPGCRLAEPGEFTRRAFMSGKLDLAAVEGLADLIAAQTEAQRRQALRQADGALGDWIAALRGDLLTAQALAESAIDFADEGDIAADALDQAQALTSVVADRIANELAAAVAAERVRDGFTVTIAGPPNAGKSTLLNALARRDVAIVSPLPGTTRDPIEVDLDLGGYAVRLIDTAGLHATTDSLEQAGIARTRARAAAADLLLWCAEAGTPPRPPADLGDGPRWTIGTKRDTAGSDLGGYDLCLSAHTGEGVPALLDRLRTAVGARLAGGETALVTRARHRQALERAGAALIAAGPRSRAPEVLAEHLREAGTLLGSIVGRIDVEDVLGEIFARFCIGK